MRPCPPLPPSSPIGPSRRVVPMLLFFLLLSLPASMPAQSLAHTREARFGIGANLSNWLEAYWLGGNWGQAGRYGLPELQAMQAAGMRTLRLPFCFVMATDTSTPPYPVDFNHPAFAWLDSVIAWTGSLGMNLIIVNQHAWELTNDNYLAKIPPMRSMWGQVAARYAGTDPERIFFEMLNEPPVGLLPANADAVNQACIDTVRQVLPQHSLVVGPHTASIGSSFSNFQPYADTNLIYTFHTYEPLYFTHQGFTWFTPQFPTGTPFPFFGDDALVTGSVDAVAQWRSQHDRPVFMGEFGVGIHADSASRCNWIRHLGQLIESRGFHALAWDPGVVSPSDFTMYSSIPANASNVVPCFGEALGLYGMTGISSLATPTRCWPNPAHDVLHLEAGWARHAALISMDGRTLAEFDLGAGDVHTLALPSKSTGMLLLRLEGEDRVAWLRIAHLP